MQTKNKKNTSAHFHFPLCDVMGACICACVCV